MAKRFYAEGFGFLFDYTSLCCPCVCISLPLSLPFIFCCRCDFNWLRLFINSIYSLCSFSAHFVFVIKLELVISFFGGLNVHSVNYTIWTFNWYQSWCTLCGLNTLVRSLTPYWDRPVLFFECSTIFLWKQLCILESPDEGILVFNWWHNYFFLKYFLIEL